MKKCAILDHPDVKKFHQPQTLYIPSTIFIFEYVNDDD